MSTQLASIDAIESCRWITMSEGHTLDNDKVTASPPKCGRPHYLVILQSFPGFQLFSRNSNFISYPG